jgi:hypothetical protein
MYSLAYDSVYWRSSLIWRRRFVFHIGWEILWPAEQLSLSQGEIKYQGEKFSPNNTTILSLKNKKFCRSCVWCIFISLLPVVSYIYTWQEHSSNPIGDISLLNILVVLLNPSILPSQASQFITHIRA